MKAAGDGRKVAVVIGATTKWQADGRNTKLVHGGPVDDSDLPVTSRWGAGGAIALRFAQEGFFVVMTTRKASNAAGLAQAIRDQGGEGLVMELDVASPSSITAAFERIRREAGDPDIVIYNAGYLEGRALPPEQELLEVFPAEMFETALDVAARGPFLVAKEVLPAMRSRGRGSLFFTNNPESLRGRRRRTGASLYYPRVMERSLAQALTEEYSEHGVHVAHLVIDGVIESPGLKTHPISGRSGVIDPVYIADACYYLHTQHPSCWTHEIQLTPSGKPVAY
jgi:NAD(P)-dependent dehydrogenase (short-subunit alcohol dehydrogenase family)